MTEKPSRDHTMTGHDKLIADLTALLKEAQELEFDDFKNEKYATPKVTLHAKLSQLACNVQDGKYDQ